MYRKLLPVILSSIALTSVTFAEGNRPNPQQFQNQQKLGSLSSRISNNVSYNRQSGFQQQGRPNLNNKNHQRPGAQARGRNSSFNSQGNTQQRSKPRRMKSF